MNLANTPKHSAPIRPPEISRCPKARNRIAVRIRVVNHDIRRVIGLDIGSEIRVDLYMVIHVLRLDGEKQAPEPFKAAEVTAHPEEVHFA